MKFTLNGLMPAKKFTVSVFSGAIILQVLATFTTSAAGFTPANIVVERVGDGSGTLSSAAAAVFVDEYLPAAASQSSPVQTVSLPNAATRPAATPFNLMASGSATSEGQMTRSTNGAVIVLPGYNGIPGDANISASAALNTNRTIGVVASAGSVDTSRAYNMLTGNNFRSVASTDGTVFWAAGQPGMVYVNAAGTLATLSSVNMRCVNIVNGQLFFSTQSGTVGIYALGSGLPTSGSPTASLVIGPTGGSPAPEGFQFNPATNICYIADSRSSKGGVFKYTFTAGSWVSNYLFSVTGGAFGLAVDWSGANPVIYATTADSKNLIKITDTGASATATTLATVDGSTKAFRGVALAPKATPVFSALTASPSVTYGTMSVTLAGKVSVTPNATTVYPASGETISIVINGNTQTTTINDATGDFSLSYNPATIPYSASAYTITYSYAGNSLLNAASDASKTLTVNKATLTYTANTASMSYGGTVPGLSGNTSGFVNGENQSGATTGTLSFTTTATSGSPAGSYAINGGGLSAANYNFVQAAGNATALTIGKAIPGAVLTSSRATNGYKDSVVFTNTLPAATTGYVLFRTNSVLWSSNNLTGGMAVSPVISVLPRGTNLVTAIYSGDGNYFGSTNNLSQLVTNHPPVAFGTNYTLNAGIISLRIVITNLLATASDVDGDAIIFVGAAVSTNGVALTNASGWLSYLNTNAVNDQFTYTVTDGFGGTNTATISIIASTNAIFGSAQAPSLGGGNHTATLNFAGIPYYGYTVQRSTNLTDWFDLWTTNAPVNGVFQFVDELGSNPPNQAYYRLRYNP